MGISMVGSDYFLGYFNCCSGRVGLLLALLSHWGEWKEVALVAEAPVDEPLHHSCVSFGSGPTLTS